jgi:hypothetical protein
MTDDGDPSLDLLLDLDGESFTADSAGEYWVKFVVKQVPPSAVRPHGLSYSLTLHDKNGKRLVGFDNAHAARAGKGRRKQIEQDHRHGLRTVEPYEYRDAATLLADFWAEVEVVLRERGVLP